MKRTKRRYLSLYLECEVLPTERECIDAVWATISRLYGEVGASQTSLALISFNSERKTAVIRVSLSTLNMVRASLASITSIIGKECSVHVLAISGTLKALAAAKQKFNVFM